MQLIDMNLTAGLESLNHIRGRYIRLLYGTGRFKIRTSTDVDSQIVAGVGVDLSGAQNEPFQFFGITSDIDQTITVLVSSLPTSDSRTTGEIGGSFQTNSGTIADATSVELFPVNLSRKEINLTIDQPIYIKGSSPSDAGGFLLPVGTHTFRNNGALYGYNDSGLTCNYSTLEDVL